MQQEQLFFESVNDALVYTVQAMGGYKKVGCDLRKDKTVDGATSWLRDCLNPGRDARLEPDQVEALARMGREAGCHAYMQYMAQSLSYGAPTPLAKADVASAAMAQMITLSRQMKAVVEQLERQGVDLNAVGAQ